MELFKREKYLSKIRGFYDADDMIKVITGVRRCGKSCLMQTIMGELSASGVPADHLIYLNLDSRSYRHVQTAEVLDQLIASYASNISGLATITRSGTPCTCICAISAPIKKEFEETVSQTFPDSTFPAGNCL